MQTTPHDRNRTPIDRLTPRSNAERNGAAAVEMAFVLPLFLLVVWGIVEFGRAMMVGQLATNAARYGARLAILDGSTNQQVIDEVREFLVDTVGGIQPNDVSVTIEVEAAPGNDEPGNQLSQSHTKDICKVTVSIPYRDVGYISGKFLDGANLRGMCAMRHE